jgi:predicted nucleic acid-binding Zn ribbon protein
VVRGRSRRDRLGGSVRCTALRGGRRGSRARSRRSERDRVGRIVRRPGPRPLSAVLEPVVRAAAPATLLAQVQVAWPEIAGRLLAASAAPVSEREGVVTVACESAVWAAELELLAPDLLARLNARVGADDAARVTSLRFVIGSGPNRP